MIKVEAYKCEYCGQIFQHEHGHLVQCKHDPKARTCVSCGFGRELKRDFEGKATGVYCPRADEVFVFPHDKYCPDWVMGEWLERADA